MKTIAYTALHYGSDYLAYAIRSVIDHIDELWVLYSATGSHGHQTDLVCPDHAQDLYTIAKQAAGDKLHWYTASPGQWRHEGEQREYIHQCVPDADVILVLDADEVWSDGLAEFAIREGTRHYPTIHNWRVPFIHYWRSFNRCIVHDRAYPVRMIIPNAPNTEKVFVVDYHNPNYKPPYPPMLGMPIHHFGYAQRSEIVEYKQHTHGHKGEWRKDVDWFQDRFMANAQEDCHPVGSEFWNPETVNPYALGLPVWMAEHPYANLEVIP